MYDLLNESRFYCSKSFIYPLKTSTDKRLLAQAPNKLEQPEGNMFEMTLKVKKKVKNTTNTFA